MTNEITVKKYISSPAVMGKIKELLHNRSSQFVVSLLSTLNTSPALAQCDPQSVLTAAMTAASLDLPINQNLGYAYMIPYKNMAQLQLGYKAFIQLAQRSGQFKTLNVSDVRTGEITHIDRLTGEILFDWIEDRNKLPVVGYVGYMELLNGFKKTMYMTVDELKAHGMRFSQTMKRGSGLWKEDFDAMASKTVIKLLLSKYAPLSVDMQTATLADQSVISAENEYEYVDNTPVLSEEVASDKERDRIVKHITTSKNKEELMACYNAIGDDDDELKNKYAEKLKTLTIK